MPSKPTTLHTCRCENCLQKGGVSDQGRPRGVTMNSREFRNHQMRLRREEESNTPAEDDLQRANDALFATTLLDDDVVPSYGTSDSDNRSSGVFSSSVINEISATISRLTMSNSEDLPSASHNQPSPSLESRRKDRSQHTIRAIKVLENARDTLRACAASLGQLPTPQTIEDAESTVRTTRHAVNGINRDVEGVVDLKLQVTQQLNNLEGRLTLLRHLSPDNQGFTYASG